MSDKVGEKIGNYCRKYNIPMDYFGEIVNEPKANLIDNDFEEAVFEQFPLIKDLRKGFYLSGAEYVSLSGSGSCLFGFYKEEKDARFFQKEMVNKAQFLTYITPPKFTTL